MEGLRLTSPAFDHGERIPEKYGYTADNTNPPLDVGGVPDEAVSLVLVVDDPDAKDPAGKVWDHWVVWNVPAAQTHVPEDWSPDEAVEGQNDYGEVGWGGPNPRTGSTPTGSSSTRWIRRWTFPQARVRTTSTMPPAGTRWRKVN